MFGTGAQMVIQVKIYIIFRVKNYRVCNNIFSFSYILYTRLGY
jgi:hypothetical protein